MLRRIAVVAAVCAATLPFTTGSASASCLDDFQVTYNPFRGYVEQQPYSDHLYNWVHVQGTATLIVEGDDLLHDVDAVSKNWQFFIENAAGNAVTATVEFADCVAG